MNMVLLAPQHETIIRRAWAMPSRDTFSIKPISELLDRWLAPCKVIVDPFARHSKRGTLTNDLNPNTPATWHMTADAFLDLMIESTTVVDAGLLDPPYSPRQIKDCYESIGMPVGQCETQHAGMISRSKDRMARLIKPGGICICCAWNSAGLGKTRGFAKREILIVNHGGSHNDTIVTVEEKQCGRPTTPGDQGTKENSDEHSDTPRPPHVAVSPGPGARR